MGSRQWTSCSTIRINVDELFIHRPGLSIMGIQGEPWILANPQSKGTRHT